MCQWGEMKSVCEGTRLSTILTYVFLALTMASYDSSGWLKSGGGLNHTTSGIMASILSLGLLEEHLKESRRLYKVEL